METKEKLAFDNVMEVYKSFKEELSKLTEQNFLDNHHNFEVLHRKYQKDWFHNVDDLEAKYVLGTMLYMAFRDINSMKIALNDLKINIKKLLE